MARFDTIVALRLAKALLTFTVGGFALLVVFGNLTDYGTNFEFVRHVLAMDAQKPELAAVSQINYRAIPWTWAHHVAYLGVILTEAVIMVTCLVSAWQQVRAVGRDDAAFQRSKRMGRRRLHGRPAAVVLRLPGHRRRMVRHVDERHLERHPRRGTAVHVHRDRADLPQPPQRHPRERLSGPAASVMAGRRRDGGRSAGG